MGKIEYGLLLALAIIQICLAGRIPREIASSNAPENCIGVSADEMKHIREYHITEIEAIVAREAGMSYEIYGKIKAANESTKNLPKTHQIATFCSIVDPEGQPINVDSLWNEANLYADKMDEVEGALPDKEKILFFKNVLCPLFRDPDTFKSNAASLDLNITQYSQFEHIRVLNKDKPLVDRVPVTRKLCGILSGETVADESKSQKELSEQQLLRFGKLEELYKSANEASSRATSFRNLCDFLNETTSTVEQD